MRVQVQAAEARAAHEVREAEARVQTAEAKRKDAVESLVCALSMPRRRKCMHLW